jgi:hypothetical protein
MSASCSLEHSVQLSGVSNLDVSVVQFVNSFRQIMDLGFIIALCYLLQHVLHNVKWIKIHYSSTPYPGVLLYTFKDVPRLRETADNTEQYVT